MSLLAPAWPRPEDAELRSWLAAHVEADFDALECFLTSETSSPSFRNLARLAQSVHHCSPLVFLRCAFCYSHPCLSLDTQATCYVPAARPRQLRAQAAMAPIPAPVVGPSRPNEQAIAKAARLATARCIFSPCRCRDASVHQIISAFITPAGTLQCTPGTMLT